MTGLSKFTDHIRGAILGALRAGASREIAAQAAGISRMTLWRWLRQGERDEATGMDTEHTRFAREIRQAESSVLASIEQSLTRTAASGAEWRASVWVLKHRLPEVYARGVDDVAKQAMANELLDFAHRRCTHEVYTGLLKALAEHGDDEIDPARLPTPSE